MSSCSMLFLGFTIPQVHLTAPRLLLIALLGQRQSGTQVVFNKHPTLETPSWVVALAAWLTRNLKAKLALRVCLTDEVMGSRTANYVGAMHLTASEA